MQLGNLKEHKIALGIGLVALFMRWCHLAFIMNSDLLRIPVIDSAFYHQWAAGISHGELAGHSIFFMSPLYPFFLGIVYTIFGIHPTWAMLLQGLLGVGTVLLLYKWVDQAIGRNVAIIAGLLAAVYSPFIFYDSTLLTSSLILFLSALILNLTDAVVRKPSTSRLLILGAALGLSALARPLALLFYPFLIAIFFGMDRQTALRKSGIALAGIALILLPISVRNLVVGGEFTLTTSSAGMNFYVGNNPDATGLYWEAPFLSSVEPQYENEDYRRTACEALQRELTTREAGNYWMMRSFDWMINSPGAYLALLGKKAFYFWNRAEFANNISIYFGKEHSPFLRFNPIGFWLIGPIGLAGLVLMVRNLGWLKSRTACFWLAAYFLGGLIFFISS
jgi:4-amino-4-deoxy-L-arabinose transferase-like glycosyltransferase